jgi:Rieske Fe-S protein
LGVLFQFFKPILEPGSFGGKVKAGRIEEFPVGTISHVQKGRFYISMLDGGMLAMWHRCTHLGCTVPWREDTVTFQGQFSGKGRSTKRPFNMSLW